MAISNQDLEEIRQLVSDHCKHKGICADDDRIVISIIVKKRRPQITVKNMVDASLLSQNPSKLWYEDHGDETFYGRRVGFILANCGVNTMHDLATGGECQVLRKRTCGRKTLNRIKKWLSEYGMTFNTEFPKEVEAEFFELKKVMG